jgi:hypothetical protein
MEAKQPPAIVSSILASVHLGANIYDFRTMAKSFSLALNDLFKIDNSLADLDAAVSEKYQPLPFL